MSPLLGRERPEDAFFVESLLRLLEDNRPCPPLLHRDPFINSRLVELTCDLIERVKTAFWLPD